MNVVEKSCGELGIHVADQRQPVRELVGLWPGEKMSGLRQPSPQRIATGVGDRIRRPPWISPGRIHDRDDALLRHQPLKLAVDVSDAEPDSGTLRICLHQGISMSRLSIGEES